MKPADLKGFTEAGRDTLARILRRVVDPDCATCGGWGTLLRDGQRVQCECAKEAK